jgi:ATP-binding cassette subfamily A (ABC1) protein 3
MLSGAMASDAGIISYRGRAVRQVESMGFCPQHDFLYPDLTVGEHIQLYGVLRNLPMSASIELDALHQVALTSMVNRHMVTLW